MGIFGKTKQEEERENLEKLKRKQVKIKNALQILGVDFDSYSDEEIENKNQEDVKRIKTDFWPNILSDLSVSLQMDSFKISSILRFSTIVYQNWILIRQNELIIRLLKKLNNNPASKS